MKTLAKRFLAKFDYRLTRNDPNRFQAMHEALMLLRRLGYTPQRIIDGGANKAQWAKLASEVYPAARLHLIEPQPACQAELEEFKKTHPATEIHPLALTDEGQPSVTMFEVDSTGSSGAFIGSDSVFGSDRRSVTAPATTLDKLLAGKILENERTLLKLDLEGHELPALRGAARLLEHIEVFITEAHIYAPPRWQRSLFADIADEIQQSGFQLFDVASLSGRSRDGRLRIGDFVFVNKSSALLHETEWS